MRLLMALCICMLFADTVVAEKLYQWDDPTGVRHFTDNPDSVPRDDKIRIHIRDEGSAGIVRPSEQPLPSPSPAKADTKAPSQMEKYGGLSPESWQQRFIQADAEKVALEGERVRQRELVESTHRKYVNSLGQSGNRPGALNTIGMKRKAYAEARSGLDALDKKIAESERRLQDLITEADNASVPDWARRK